MKIAAAGLAVLVLAAAGPAAAADFCSQTTIVATAPMTLDGDGQATIAVSLGGVGKIFAIDTGSAISELTQSAADEMHLATFRNQFGLYNPSGNVSEIAAAVASFGIGNVSTRNFTFRISNASRGMAAGAVGTDVMRAYDLDFDFGGGKFNLVSPDHCVGKVITWQASAVAVVNVTVTAEGRIVLPLTIDGHALKALLDTGAATSSMTAQTARALGAASSAVGGEATFAALALEGISVTNPKVSVVKLLKDSSNKPVDGADMTLGLNVLKHLHLYVAYREQRLYITPK